MYDRSLAIQTNYCHTDLNSVLVASLIELLILGYPKHLSDYVLSNEIHIDLCFLGRGEYFTTNLPRRRNEGRTVQVLEAVVSQDIGSHPLPPISLCGV